MSNRAAYVLSAALVLAALINGLCSRYELHTPNDINGFYRLNRLTGSVLLSIDSSPHRVGYVRVTPDAPKANP